MKRGCLLLLLLLIVVTGCSAGKPSVAMPEEMPADFDFHVRYGYGEVSKNEINTYKDTVTKDLIMNGSATASLTLTPDEMRTIYANMKKINIMAKKKLLPDKQNCYSTPFSEDNWKVSVNGETNTFSWSNQHCEITDDAQQLLDLRTFIHEIVTSKEAYKELPEAEGGYD
jgi:hypothetical protein